MAAVIRGIVGNHNRVWCADGDCLVANGAVVTFRGLAAPDWSDGDLRVGVHANARDERPSGVWWGRCFVG